MSTGRIMTLTVESLNKLYFQFIELFLLPHLAQPSQECAQLLKHKSAYEVHRFLEDLILNSQPNDNISTHTNSSTSSFQLNTATPNKYAVSVPMEPHTTPFNENPHTFNKSTEKKFDQRKSLGSKMGMRKALTGLTFDERYDYKTGNQDKLMQIPNLNQSVGNDSLPPIPTLNSSISSDFKIDYELKDRLYSEPRDRFRSSKEKGVELRQKQKEVNFDDRWQKGRLMKQCVSKISKLFNENHSKIEKYGRKVQSQNKLFNLNISTKLERKQQVPRLKQYQFHAKQQIHSRKF